MYTGLLDTYFKFRKHVLDNTNLVNTWDKQPLSFGQLLFLLDVNDLFRTSTKLTSTVFSDVTNSFILDSSKKIKN